ncbi:hypothetical protein [Alkalicoccus daliensis]|uniref:DUF3298 domain-containing protein n=1 Tax=Alkalicoccus daliensis TaxID=745820 RepID=A0A1H0ES01_9BACI|nr:hypothetical protein [Alkalicoccus daliensis]SDN85247.1 hypothetical protein SAMN04488053_10443 [Alkalicoccus daliensis]
MKKSMFMIAGTVVFAPITLAACGNETENTTDENVQEETVQENNTVETNEEDSVSEIENLAEEHDLEVRVEESSGEAPEATLEELEEAFGLISSIIHVERLEFIESPQEGEVEESGEAEGHYAVHGADGEFTDPVLLVRFEYEMEDDVEEDVRHPPFRDITNGETEFTGPELIEWEESHLEVQSTGDRTIAEFYAEGEWHLSAEYEGAEVHLEEPDEWLADFPVSVLVGVEE